MHPGVLLKNYGLRASKKRGQNFLTQPPTANAIAQASGVKPDDHVLEIGGGLGALTLALSRLAKKVVTLEVDRGVYAALLEILAGEQAENVTALERDALKFDLEELAAEAGQPLLVCGNLPYNISSPLLFKLVESRSAWRGATLLLQREACERAAAGPGSKDYGVLSVLLQAYLSIKAGLILGPEQFFPRPNVDSRLLHLAPLKRAAVPPAGEELFSRVVKAAFSQRRKTLGNSLAAGLKAERPALAEMLANAGIDPGRRAETLSVAEFVAVAEAVRHNNV